MVSTKRLVLLIAAIAVSAAAVVLIVRSRNALPAPGSDTYEQVTRAFYRGLASLEVGLLDDAKREFTTVTTQVAEEPAAWANLGLAHLRLGELDAAAAPIERAVMLAPDNGELVLLAGRMEISRGRLDEGLVHLRRAVELDPDALQPRFALAEEVERAGAPDADAQALMLLDELTMLAPANVAVLVERARVAAKARDLQRLNDSIARLKPVSATWPELAVEQYRALEAAVASNDLAMAQRATAFLRNVLARVPAFGEDLGAIRTPTELIAEPVQRFIALAPPPATPATPDLTLSFTEEPIGSVSSVSGRVFVLPSDGDKQPRIFVAGTNGNAAEVRSLTGPAVLVTLPRKAAAVDSAAGVVVADWNNDFRLDIITVISGEVRVLLQQGDGTFVDQTPSTEIVDNRRFTGVWAADIEMDGDVDIIAAPESDGVVVLRNNADGSWTPARTFEQQRNVIAFGWADMDGDSDPDALFLDSGSGSAMLTNLQAGSFSAVPSPPVGEAVGMTVADVDSDGRFEFVAIDRAGTIRAASFTAGTWSVRQIARWPDFQPQSFERLIAADFDNSGAMDLLGTGGSNRMWLGDASRQLQLLAAALPSGPIVAAGDMNSDGRLDLVAGPRRLVNRGSANYHWKQVRPRAQANAGDQRINSFGVGGYLEARAGLLFQKHLLTGGPVHIGLGTQSSIDVARIVWPNGVPQAEFGVGVDDGMVAEQRLKGSCPWLFTWDGTRMVFVTDFLWRSPLGLRINAQDTAGVTQTEDWVRIRGDQLGAHDGFYDVRVTAELWETHYFDHVSLMAVDHPEGTEVFVDERFSAAAQPALKVHALQGLRPVPRAWDHRGADVTAAVTALDGRYLSTFARGRYQGIAEEHFVEIEPGAIGDGAMLVASGWIYPTDSSVNMAIAQGGISPRGLSLEAQNADGTWRVVTPDLGFPAGKNKTILVDLSGAAGARRVRLRTNLEIYWDALQVGTRADAPLRTTRIDASGAELRYRGFSNTVSPRGDAPETPEYDRIASTSPRWRDLIGYHTRFGDVGELTKHVDDRYVIMNAGDELRFRFREAPPPAQGWKRDFVLIGDGWEKDGDYNTGFSQTVLPLPSHDRPAYGQGTTSLALEDDPVYRRHRQDWEHYHTRYVTPQRFLNGLRLAREN